MTQDPPKKKSAIDEDFGAPAAKSAIDEDFGAPSFQQAPSPMTTPLPGAAAEQPTAQGTPSVASSRPSAAGGPFAAPANTSPAIQVSDLMAPREQTPPPADPVQRTDTSGDDLAYAPGLLPTKQKEALADIARRFPGSPEAKQINAQLEADAKVRATPNKAVAAASNTSSFDPIFAQFQEQLGPAKAYDFTNADDPRRQRLEADAIKYASVDPNVLPYTPALRADMQRQGAWDNKKESTYLGAVLSHASDVVEGKKMLLEQAINSAPADPNNPQADQQKFDVLKADIDAQQEFIKQGWSAVAAMDPKTITDKIREKQKKISDGTWTAATVGMDPVTKTSLLSTSGVAMAAKDGADKVVGALALAYDKLFTDQDKYSAADRVIEAIHDSAKQMDAEVPTEMTAPIFSRDEYTGKAKWNMSGAAPQLVRGITALWPYVLLPSAAAEGAGSAAVGALDAKATVFGLAYADGYNGFVERANEANDSKHFASQEQIAAQAKINGLVTAAIFSVNPNIGPLRPVVTRSMEATAMKALKDGATPAASVKLMLQDAMRGGAAQSMISAATQISDNVSNNALNEVSSANLPTIKSVEEFGVNMANAAVMGMVLGASHSNAFSAERADAIKAMAEEPEVAHRLIDEIEQRVKAQGGNWTEADKFRERLDKLAKTYKGNDLSKEEPQRAAKVAGLIMRKNDVETDMRENPADAAIVAAQGDPRKAEHAKMTAQVYHEKGIPEDRAALSMAALGMLDMPEGAKVTHDAQGMAQLEVKDGEDAPSKKEVMSDLIGQYQAIRGEKETEAAATPAGEVRGAVTPKAAITLEDAVRRTLAGEVDEDLNDVITSYPDDEVNAMAEKVKAEQNATPNVPAAEVRQPVPEQPTPAPPADATVQGEAPAPPAVEGVADVQEGGGEAVPVATALTEDVANTPQDLASAYISAIHEHNDDGNPESVLSALTTGNVSRDSYVRFGDQNNIAQGFAKTYLRKKGRGIDDIAQEASEITGRNITPDDVVGYMHSFPEGRPMRSERMAELSDRHRALTGKGINKRTAKLLLDKAKKNPIAHAAIVNDVTEAEVLAQHEAAQAAFDAMSEEEQTAIFDEREQAEQDYLASIDAGEEAPSSSIPRREDGKGRKEPKPIPRKVEEPQAPAQAEAPLPKKEKKTPAPKAIKETAPKVEKPKEEVKPTEKASFKRENPTPVDKPTVIASEKSKDGKKHAVEYAIPGFEEYRIVVQRVPGGYQITEGTTGAEITGQLEGSAGLAAGKAMEVLKRVGKEKLDKALQAVLDEQVPKQQKPSLPPTINIDGKERSTTNSKGQQIHPTEDGVRNFWKWFGDSKVVDEQGRPLVMYHGTGDRFNTFENKGGVVVTPISVDKVSRAGFFFTANESAAKEYGSVIVPVYLRSSKVADLQYPDQKLWDELEESGFNTRFLDVRQPSEQWEVFDGDNGPLFISALRDHGYDGVSMVEPDNTGELIPVIAVFYPSQIKSATGNSGAFDPSKPSILEQRPKLNLPGEISTGKPNVDKALNALSEIAPDITIKVYDTPADFAEGTKDIADGAESTWGIYDPRTNEIHVNPASPDVKQTLMHEAAHPLLIALAKNDPGTFIKFHEELMAHPDAQKYRDHAANYTDQSEASQMAEALAEFMGDAAAGKIPVSTDPKSLWQRLKAFIKDILAKLGWDIRTVDMSKPQNVRDFAAAFAKAMNEGIKMTGFEPVGKKGSKPLFQYTEAEKTRLAELRATEEFKSKTLAEQKKAEKEVVSEMRNAPDAAPETFTAKEVGRLIKELAAGVAKVKFDYGFDRAAFSEKAKGRKEGMKEQAAADRVAEKQRASEREGKRKEFVEHINKFLEPLKSKLTAGQVKAIVNKALNVTNPLSARKFAAYAGKVIANAEYAEQLQYAKDLQKKAKKLSRTSTIPLNHRDALAVISTAEVSYLEDPSKFIAGVENYLRSFLPVTDKDYVPGNSASMLKLVEDVQKEADAVRAQELKDNYGIEDLGGLDPEELQDALDADDIDAFANNLSKSKRTELEDVVRQIADYSKMSLEDVSAEGRIKSEVNDLADMRTAPTELMSLDQLRDYIKAADNIVVNDSYNGTGKVLASIRAAKSFANAAKIVETTPMKAVWTNRLGKFVQHIYTSDADLFRYMFGFTDAMAKFQVAIGWDKLLAAKTQFDTEIREAKHAAEEFYRKEGKAGSNTINVRVAEGIVAHAIQPISGATPEQAFSAWKEMFQESINRKKRAKDGATKKLAVVEQAVYDELLAPATSREDLLDRLKKAYPAAAKSMNFMQNILIKPYTQRVLAHQENFRNAAVDHGNEMYFPISFRKVGVMEDIESPLNEEGIPSDKVLTTPKVSANLIKRKGVKSLPEEDSVIDTNLRANVLSGLKNNLYDVLLSPHREQIKQFFKLPGTTALVGGQENKAFMVHRMGQTIKQQLGRKPRMSTEDRMLNKVAQSLRKYVSATQLGGFLQLPKQASDQLVNAVINTGGVTPLRMIAEVHDAMPLLSLASIGERGVIIGGTNWMGQLQADAGRLDRALKAGKTEDARVLYEKITRLWMASLTASDVYSARASWLSYYKQYIERNGGKVEPWADEAEMVRSGDQLRREALTYAESATDITQGSSDPSKNSELASPGESGAMNLLKVMFNPFSTINTQIRSRIINDVADIAHYGKMPAFDAQGNPTDAKKASDAAMKSLSATAASQAAYTAMKFALAATIISGMKQLLRSLFSDDDKGDEDMAVLVLAAHILHATRLLDADVYRAVESAHRDAVKSHEPGFNEQEVEAAAKDRRFRMAYTSYMTGLAAGGVPLAEPAMAETMNRAAYLWMLYKKDQSVMKNNGEPMKFDAWLRKTDRTPFLAYGQGYDEPNFGMLSAVLKQGSSFIDQISDVAGSDEKGQAGSGNAAQIEAIRERMKAIK